MGEGEGRSDGGGKEYAKKLVIITFVELFPNSIRCGRSHFHAEYKSRRT